MNTVYLQGIKEHTDLFSKLYQIADCVEDAGQKIADSLNNGGKLLLCGNGGSAADCQHLASELTGRFVRDRKPLAALSLATDTSALTSISNDYSYNEVFSRQILALGNTGDILLAISTSGNSESVIRAVAAAKEKKIYTIGLLGKGGGSLADLCDLSIIIPSDTTARIQEAHIFIGHTICALIEKNLGLA